MRRISLSLYSLTSVLFGWQVSLMLWKALATVIVNGIFGTNYGAYIAGKTLDLHIVADVKSINPYGLNLNWLLGVEYYRDAKGNLIYGVKNEKSPLAEHNRFV